MARGDPGVNPLDAACRKHDIAYRDYRDIESRHRADKILEEAAWNRFRSPNASLSEKTAALAVRTAMKTKQKLGMGCSKKTSPRGYKKAKKVKKAKKIPFKGGFLNKIAKIFKKSNKNAKKVSNTRKLIKNALVAAKRIVKESGGKRKFNIPRIIPVPKEGGVLPLIPIFAGLSALGGLVGGFGGIFKAINQAKHNRNMEAIAVSKKGNALYLRPYKTGRALYLRPYQQTKN